MKTQFRWTVLTLTVSLGAIAYADAPATRLPAVDDALVAQLKDAAWTPFPLTEVPPGLQVWRIAGDAKTGPSITYAKFPAGYVFPTHWHSHAEMAVVISGTLHYAVEGKLVDLAPGSVIVFPAKQRHSTTCDKLSACIVLVRRTGAADYNFVK